MGVVDTEARPSERAVLDVLLSAPREGVTRAELRDLTGLSPATLVNLLRANSGRLSDLVEVVNGTAAPTSASGSVARYRLRHDVAYALAIELGRQHVRVAIGDALGNVVSDARGAPRDRTVDEIAVDRDPWRALDIAADAAADLIHEAQDDNLRRDQFVGIGVSVTSAIEPESKMFRAGNVPDAWEGIRPIEELKKRLERRDLRCPVIIDKDSNHGALAQQRWGAARGVDNFLFVKWAHGVSAGIVLGGRLQRGARGSAGALGHSPLVEIRPPSKETDPPSAVYKPDSRTCYRCGKSDCLEVMISVDRLRKVVAAKKNLGNDQSLWPSIGEIQQLAMNDPERMTANANVEAKVLRAAAKRLGNALGAAANLLNPELIVIGGLFTNEHYDLLNDRIRDGMRTVATAPAYRDVDLRFTDFSIIDGIFASVLSGRRLARVLL